MVFDHVCLMFYSFFDWSSLLSLIGLVCFHYPSFDRVMPMP